MPLPPFNAHGDLPEGIYQATLQEVIERFGDASPQRELVTARLIRVYEIAQHTGKLQRFVIFGSYATANPAPNDVDIILVMRDDFTEQDFTEEALQIFDHLRAQHEMGASIFWTRPGAVLLETVDEFVAHWQIKRDHSQRGIVEIISEKTE